MFAGAWAFCDQVLDLDSDMGSAIAGAIMAVITMPLTAWATERRDDPPATQLAQPAAVVSLDEVRPGYLERLRRRWNELDIGVLAPRPDRDDNMHIPLAEVFVGQSAKADPPLLELPRELLLQLDDPDAAPRDLPEGIDPADLERARQAYRQRQAAPVLDLLAGEGRRLMLLGDVGAGKSTLARYVALTLADGQNTGALSPLAGWLPVLVELRRYTQRGGDATFLDFLDDLHRQEGSGLPRPQLERYLKEDGRAIVVFDGLDEVFDPRTRERTAEQIAWFADRFPKARVVVTSRPLDDQSTILPGFARHKLADLDREQIGDFVRRWYRAALPQDPATAGRLTAQLLAAIDDSAAVRELAGNPLLLTILAIMGRRRKLPRHRVAVYRHAVGVLTEQWDRGKKLSAAAPTLDARDRLRILRLIARRMQHAPGGLSGNFITEADLLDVITAYLRARDTGLPHDRARSAATAIVHQFHQRNFILSEFGEDVYGFVHRSFLEYLVADDIRHRFHDEGSIDEADLVAQFATRWRDPSWHEVLVLAAGMLDERTAARAVAGMLAADPHWAADRRAEPHHVLLAVRCLGEMARTGVAAAEGCRAAVDHLIRVLTVAHRRIVHHYDDALHRAVERIALPVLAGAGHWPGRERYLAWYTRNGLVDTNDPTTGALATRLAVALCGDDPALYTFLHAKAYHGWSVHHRQAAVWAIATAWPDDAERAAVVHERVTADPDPEVRLTALQAVAAARPDDPRTIRLLRRLAGADRHEEVRRAALTLLAQRRRDDPDTLELLRTLARQGQPRQLRQAAVQAIADHAAHTSTAAVLLRHWAVHDPAEDVRITALRGIATSRRGDTDTPRLLRSRAEGDPSVDVRRAAIWWLADGWRDDRGTLPWLRTQALEDPDAGVRQTALLALAEGWPDQADTLALLSGRAVDDPSAEVREAAVEALHTVWADDPALPARLRTIAAADPAPEVRQAAVRALADPRREDPRTLTWLREFGDGAPDELVRLTAVRMVADGRHDAPQALAWLRDKAAADTSPGVRAVALRAVAAGRHDDTTRSFLRDRSVEDPDADVRHDAVQAIVTGWPGAPDTAGWLRRLAVADQGARVRNAALHAVAAHWRDDPATPAFLRARLAAVADGHEDVRRAAVWCLADGWPDDDATLPALRDGTADPHHQVRTAAVRALAGGWQDNAATLSLLRERAVGDPDGYVRRTALLAVAAHRHDDPSTLALLVERAAADPLPPVRLELLSTVVAGWTHDEPALALVLDRAVRDGHQAVRRAAVQALAERWPDEPRILPVLRESAEHDPDEDVRLSAARALASRTR